QFIRGLSEPIIREKLLQEKDLTFGNATKIALALEASKLGNRVLSSSTEREVNKVTVSKPSRRQNSTSKNSTYTNRKPHKTKSKLNYADLGLDGICLRCGLNNHLVKDCQKDRSTFRCSSCHKTGHVAKVCIITLTKNKKNKSVNLIIEDNDSSCGESQFSNYHIVTINNTLLQGDNKLTVPIKIGSGTILFEIDTGSPISIISEQVFREACPNVNLNSSAMPYRTLTGEVFKPIGIAKVQISYENKTSEEDIYVISASSSPLHGRSWLQHLNIDVNRLLCNPIQNVNTVSYSTASKLKDQILKRYSQTFSEKIGKIPNYTCSLKLKNDNIKPIFIKHRQVPYALQEK
ncbi:hypothetical protein ILUMI_05939, partial [Ignelater luminosus]